MLKLLRRPVILTLLILLIISVEVSGAGQPVKGKRFDVGLKASLGLGSIGGADGDQYEKTRIGFIGGGFVRFSATKIVSIEADVSYVRKGGKGEILVADYKTNEVYTADEVMVLDRIEFAQLAVFTVPLEGKIQPSFLAGLSVAFGGKSEIDVDGFDPVDISEYTQSTSVGFLLGAELAYRLGSKRAFVDVRYSRDFGDFFEPESFEWVSQVISIGVGVGFKI